jgi:hypothetical protein
LAAPKLHLSGAAGQHGYSAIHGAMKRLYTGTFISGIIFFKGDSCEKNYFGNGGRGVVFGSGARGPVSVRVFYHHDGFKAGVCGQ